MTFHFIPESRNKYVNKCNFLIDYCVLEDQSKYTLNNFEGICSIYKKFENVSGVFLPIKTFTRIEIWIYEKTQLSKISIHSFDLIGSLIQDTLILNQTCIVEFYECTDKTNIFAKHTR